MAQGVDQTSWRQDFAIDRAAGQLLQWLRVASAEELFSAGVTPTLGASAAGFDAAEAFTLLLTGDKAALLPIDLESVSHGSEMLARYLPALAEASYMLPGSLAADAALVDWIVRLCRGQLTPPDDVDPRALRSLLVRELISRAKAKDFWPAADLVAQGFKSDLVEATAACAFLSGLRGVLAGEAPLTQEVLAARKVAGDSAASLVGLLGAQDRVEALLRNWSHPKGNVRRQPGPMTRGSPNGSVVVVTPTAKPATKTEPHRAKPQNAETQTDGPPLAEPQKTVPTQAPEYPVELCNAQLSPDIDPSKAYSAGGVGLVEGFGLEPNISEQLDELTGIEYRFGGARCVSAYAGVIRVFGKSPQSALELTTITDEGLADLHRLATRLASDDERGLDEYWGVRHIRKHAKTLDSKGLARWAREHVLEEERFGDDDDAPDAIDRRDELVESLLSDLQPRLGGEVALYQLTDENNENTALGAYFIVGERVAILWCRSWVL